MRRFVLAIWICILAFCLLGGFAHARGSQKKVKITNAVVFPDQKILYIYGSGFSGNELKVWLETEGERRSLDVDSSTDSEIQVSFPPGLEGLEGTYRLVVVKCKYWKRFRAHRGDDGDDEDDGRFWGRRHCSEDSLDITVGAVGPEGPQGEVGPQGERGPQGPEGNKGDKGDTGPLGPRGYTGATGSQGPTGATGSQGPTGDKPAHQWSGTSLAFENPDGTMGTSVDLKGPKGDKGDKGDLGLAGKTCPAGSFVQGFDANGDLICAGASELVNFPAPGDTFSDSGQRLWRLGQYVEGTRTTSLGTVRSAELHIVMSYNSLGCDNQDLRMLINGTEVGRFSVVPGASVLDTSFSFGGISGPTYTLRYENVRTVNAGCGSAQFSTSDSTVLLTP